MKSHLIEREMDRMKNKKETTTTNLYIIKSNLLTEEAQEIHDVEHERKQKRKQKTRNILINIFF